ncbi:tRNA 2-thiouridine(34) synthase MnmA [Spirochaetia bacterium 38H-sp]|uniref:tRNA-specific 2-thiouridylase MnmA n=1 Tax=Rarispira pelagica TaxID=3141764 RepID=A0ABU9U9Y3_9SPIR
MQDSRNPSKIVVAMSGGIDSSAVACMLKEKGMEVIGLTFIRIDAPSEVDAEGLSDEAKAAKQVADQLGIQHIVLNLHDLYSDKVLSRAWQEYSTGRTPNPCVLCNRNLKFGFLVKYATENLGADGLATGHYAKLSVSDSSEVFLRRGEDTTKDQTYFLAQTKKEDLARAYFPLGSMIKKDVREYAKKMRLATADRKESQDVCFNTTGLRFGSFLESFFDKKTVPGDIVDEEGNVLGRHEGIHTFTVGQRRGIGIASGKPIYVKAVDADTNRVIVTDNPDRLLSRTVVAEELNWLMPPEKLPERVTAKIRYAHKPSPATVEHTGNSIKLVFDEPQRAITPGQLLVVYDSDRVAVSGFISHTE